MGNVDNIGAGWHFELWGFLFALSPFSFYSFFTWKTVYLAALVFSFNYVLVRFSPSR